MDRGWLESFLGCPDFQGMGHGQSLSDLNLGLGWVYYGLCRALRPQRIVCIGSYRGFVPILFARALKDNSDDGHVLFIDPSFVDDFWKDQAEVWSHFDKFDAGEIEHHCLTTQKFVASQHFANLGSIDFLFIDGFHSAEQVRFDHEAFIPKLSPRHLVFFHDSLSNNLSTLYGEDKQYNFSVFEYVDELKASGRYQVLDVNVEHGLSIVRSVDDT
ncbi:class I SAM-dependent methyltransferase [Sphingorhabdus sp. EL138]|uniref:class I SAM-dependent methyltransferase n=1 Tax=Sphingorhabdus sp. EL138 TaxID=2073156 RepID=UPI003455FDDF